MRKKRKIPKCLEKAGNLLEQYNWHTIATFPEEIFEDIEIYIKKGKSLKVAKIIANKFNFFK